MLALAGPVASETPTVPLPVPLPPGVVSTLVTRELAQRPRSVNGGDEPATVYVVSAPHTGGPFLLRPRGATFRPPPPDPSRPPIPEVVPSPEELVLPPGARVVYESALALASWAWPEGGAEIDWSFQYWTEPVSGTLEGRLSPPRSP